MSRRRVDNAVEYVIQVVIGRTSTIIHPGEWRRVARSRSAGEWRRSVEYVLGVGDIIRSDVYDGCDRHDGGRHLHRRSHICVSREVFVWNVPGVSVSVSV